MKNNHRKQLLAVYGQLYTFDARGDRYKCVYCGDVRECVDHVPPLTLVESKTPEALRDAGVMLITYPCCSTCNEQLGSKPLATYEERLIFLYNRYLDKADRQPMWQQWEIDELGGELKKLVLARQLQLRRELLARIRGIEHNMGDIRT